MVGKRKKHYSHLTTGQLAELLTHYGLKTSVKDVKGWVLEGWLTPVSKPPTLTKYRWHQFSRGEVELFLRTQLPVFFKAHGNDILAHLS